MSLFGTIMHKIFHHGEAAQPAPAPQAAQPAPQAAPQAAPQPASAAAPAAPAQSVDVEAVLTDMANTKGGGNWRSSIVDLLKLLDLDSSLQARKELAGELGVHVGADGSAEENIALHKAVMRKLADNGGTVPADLKD